MMWPFICQQGFNDFFWIIDAFSPNLIYRIFFPGKDLVLQQFFIYDYRIYFLLMCEIDKCYQLWSIDLKTITVNYQLIKHFEYTFQEVGDKPFLDLFVRGESRETDQ
jgi:hypothetical protein